jgi:hypothetical protein
VVSALQPSLPDAFVLAVGFLQAGDVLLVEVQNNFGGPVEIGSPLLFGRLYPAVDDAVFRAVTCIAYDGFPIGCRQSPVSWRLHFWTAAMSRHAM